MGKRKVTLLWSELSTLGVKELDTKSIVFNGENTLVSNVSYNTSFI